MANTPYYTKAEVDAIDATLRKDYNYGNIQFRESLAIAYIPTADGWYFATESGTYTNAGNLVVDISNNLVIIIVSDTQTTFSKVDIPLNITFDAVPTLGSANAVESGGVYDSDANILLYDFLVPTSNFTTFPKNSILSIDYKQTANIKSNKNYYIAFFYNTSNPNFLLQIKDELGSIVSQYFLSSSNLTGKQTLLLNNSSDGLPFADIYIDADLVPTSSQDFGQNFELKKPTTIPSYILDDNIASSQKISKTLNLQGKELDKEIDLTNSFPFYDIKEIKVVQPPNDIENSFFTSSILKDLYITYVRINGVAGATSTIIQIGEKIGSNVGVNQNVWASISSTDTYTKDIVTFRLIGSTSNALGLELDLTLDISNITGTLSLTDECPLYVERLYQQSKNCYSKSVIFKEFTFWKNPKNLDFDYTSILRVDVLSGSNDFFYDNGVLRELYFTFFRFRGLDTNPPTNIVQIAYKDGSTVGLNNKTFASTGTDERDLTGAPITVFELLGSSTNGFNGLKIRVTIDTSKIPNSIQGSATLSDSLQLDTLSLVEQLNSTSLSQPLLGKKVVCFGDSVTEFGTYPEQIGFFTGAQTYNIGFGGCHLAQRSDSSDYNELGMVKVSEAVASQDFTAMQTAVNNLANLPTPDDNTVNFNRLVSIDFDTVDFVTIFYGTNDFTANKVIGSSTSIDTFEITGAVNYIVETLQTAYPQLKILFVTPTHRFFNTNDDSDLVPNSIGNFLIEYCDAIESQSEKNHTPTLNLYKKGGFNKYNHFYYFGSDNVHPNSIGYTYLSQKISAYLSKLFKTY